MRRSRGYEQRLEGHRGNGVNEKTDREFKSVESLQVGPE